MVTKFVRLLMTMSTIIAILFGFALPDVPQSAGVSEPLPAIPEYCTADEISGAGATVFYVVRPKAEALDTVYAADFGFSAANTDNFTAFADILNYCRQHPKTRVVFAPGDYAFNTDAGFGLDGLTDIYFEGNGARFVFSYPGAYMMPAE